VAALTVAVVTPEGMAYEGPASTVVVPGHDGEVAFLPGHAPFVGALGAGELRIETPQGPRRFFLEGGVVQVMRDSVSVLAERATDAAAVDAEKARADLARALAERPAGDEAIAARERRATAARARLRVASRR
jgi:F-type H+-transporting ATPase subunit epsilon